MKKTPTIFKRDPNNMRLVLDEPSGLDVAWVFEGEGYPTRKFDGTACLVKDSKLYKRYERKPRKTAPDGFKPAQETDPNTGKQPGWVPVGDGPEDKYHREAFDEAAGFLLAVPDGVYELVGPKIQGNKEGGSRLELISLLFAEQLEEIPRTFDAIKAYLEKHKIEGIVWHYGDRWAKIKRRDFGLKW